MLSGRGKTPTLGLLLKSCIDVILQKYYVTLGIEISWYKMSKFRSLKLDESRYIMKGID